MHKLKSCCLVLVNVNSPDIYAFTFNGNKPYIKVISFNLEGFMKKLLLGSTALIGAAAFTAPALADAKLEFSVILNTATIIPTTILKPKVLILHQMIQMMMTVPISIMLVPIWH